MEFSQVWFWRGRDCKSIYYISVHIFFLKFWKTLTQPTGHNRRERNCLKWKNSKCGSNWMKQGKGGKILQFQRKTWIPSIHPQNNISNTHTHTHTHTQKKNTHMWNWCLNRRRDACICPYWCADDPTFLFWVSFVHIAIWVSSHDSPTLQHRGKHFLFHQRDRGGGEGENWCRLKELEWRGKCKTK